jgi:hypothetical protein
VQLRVRVREDLEPGAGESDCHGAVTHGEGPMGIGFQRQNFVFKGKYFQDLDFKVGEECRMQEE